MAEVTYEIHVPTEQYGFITARIEGNAHDAIEKYTELKEAWDSEGLPHKEWNAFIDAYLNKGSMNPDMQEQLERCSKAQRWFINEVKKSFKRMNHAPTDN